MVDGASARHVAWHHDVNHLRDEAADDVILLGEVLKADHELEKKGLQEVNVLLLTLHRLILELLAEQRDQSDVHVKGLDFVGGRLTFKLEALAGCEKAREDALAYAI